MIRVLICDDQVVVREGLRAILRAAPGIEVVGAASDGAEAVDVVPETRPDVVLMDLKMPGANGIWATRQIRDRYPEVRVLVLTTFDADEWVFDAIRAGASGYLLKDAPREQLIAAITATADNRTWVDSAVAGKLFRYVTQHPTLTGTAVTVDLTERERNLLRLVARGLANADIAKRLFLSEGTVRNYLTSIFQKLGVTDRTQAAVVALRHGLVEPDES